MFIPKTNLQNLSYPELLSYFNQLFDKLAMRHSSYNAFENFLDCCINGFSFNYDKDIMDRIRKTYSQEERNMFGEMIRIWIICMEKRVRNDNSFFDFFGTFYEEKAMSKQSGFAQYFTPESICQLMVSIVGLKEGKHVMEPACGSGRFNLAMHANNHQLIHHANDLDITCAKMTSLNFLIHGVKGIVTCDDALVMQSFKGAFFVNFDHVLQLEYIDNADLAYSLLNNIFPRSNPKLEIDMLKLAESDLQVKNDFPANVSSLSELGKQLSLF